MTWQPKNGELRPGEIIIAAHPRKMAAIGERRALRQAGRTVELRKLEGERESRWCLIVRTDAG
jgi:hypothetical protein